MFGNTRTMNNNGNGINVNSSLSIYYSDTCMLKVGAWNTNLSLKFHPFKGLNAEGIRQYAQDNTEIINTSLVVDNVSILLKGIKEDILPALKEKKEKSISVMVGLGANKKVIGISTKDGRVSLDVYVGVQEDGKADPNNKLSHMFNIKEYIINYDPVSGQGEVVLYNAEFDNFIETLKDIYKLNAATPHAIKYNNALKTSFANNTSQQNTQPSYQAPQSNIPNGDMGSFLPFN